MPATHDERVSSLELTETGFGEPPIPAAPSRLAALLKEHGITPDEYARIESALGRAPTITELGIYSVMWSEHCSYKSSRVHLKRLPTRSKLVVQGPGENAGIIDIGDGWACAFKIESHNHPSYIEPFQGAATGVGGILRDIFTMGARPLAVMDSLRFGPLQPRDGKPDAQTLAKNHSVVEGVVSGIAHYGNCFGVPNLGGEARFEPCYSGNPLVNAFALGIVRRDDIFYAKAAGVGNPVIYVGAKTGRDGIHGATMASEEFKEGSEQKRPNVQMGDPFLEKLLLEACLEAMRTGAIVGIQDMGAAGLTCSTCEMGARGNVGVEIELDRVPQRESGMTPYEIMLSESQERMLLVAEKGREDEIFRVFRKWGLDAVTVGRVIPESTMRVLKGGKIVAQIPNQSLTDDAPLYHRPVGEWRSPFPPQAPPRVHIGANADHTTSLKRLLSALNVCSKRWIYEQYDTMVQTNTVAGPGYDGGIMRVKGTSRGLAMSLDGNGRWCALSPKLGAMHAVAEAARNVACTGATPVAATNCLNFANPEKPPIMRQLSDAIDGIAEACTALGTPITGGNVSLYNETLGDGIYPTPVVGIVGIIEDVAKSISSQFPAAGLDVLLLSGPSSHDNEQTFGSSEYAKELLGAVWGTPPALDLAHEAALQQLLIAAIDRRLIRSAHDIADGGLAVAAAECCMARPSHRPMIGARLELNAADLNPTDASTSAEIALFGEAASRVLISCDPACRQDIEDLASEKGILARRIGATIPATRLEIVVQGTSAINAQLADLKDIWAGALERALGLKA